MHRISPNCQLDAAALLSENALHQRDVRFFDGPLAKSFAESGVCRIIFRHQDHTGSFLVQAVHDSRPQRIPALRKRLPAPQKRVDQRAGNISGACVNGHPRGLVDGDDVVVFVKHIERNRLRFGAGRWPRMGPHGDEFPAAQFLRRFRRFTIDEDQPAVDQFLHARARELRAMGGHKPVQPRPSVCIHRQ